MDIARTEADAFSDFLALHGYNSNTILQSQEFMRQYSYPLDIEGVEKFIINCRKKGLEPTTINRYLCYLRSYFKFKKIEYEVKDVTVVKQKMKVVIPDEDIERFLSLPYTCLNHRLFWHIMAFAPFRLGEVANLKKENVDLLGREFLVYNTKTGMNRVIPIQDRIYDLVKEGLQQVQGDYLCPLSKDAWKKQFDRRIKVLGMPKRKGLTANSLRHSCITSLLDNGANPFTVCLLAGHASPNTTMNYYHNSRKAMKQAVSKLSLIQNDQTVQQFLLSMRDKVIEVTPDKLKSSIAISYDPHTNELKIKGY